MYYHNCIDSIFCGNFNQFCISEFTKLIEMFLFYNQFRFSVSIQNFGCRGLFLSADRSGLFKYFLCCGLFQFFRFSLTVYVYRFRLLAVCIISSVVVIALEFISYARCATIRLTISVATCTLEPSKYPCTTRDF